jgi:hypothetical protein
VASVIFLNPVTVGEIGFLPIKLWTLLLSALGLKKRRPWGTVYDDITKQPLDPAYVVLVDQAGNQVDTSITDLDGRYGFFIKQPGIYKLVANKTDYKFPGANLFGKTRDEIYENLYFGEEITIHREGEVIAKDIPMDPLKFNWNEYAKNQQNLMKFYNKRQRLLYKISTLMFVLGFSFSFVVLLLAPIPYNAAIFALYIVILLLRTSGILSPKKKGILSDSQTGLPLSFAVVNVYSFVHPDLLVKKVVANMNGEYYCLVSNGRYILKIERKNTDGSYTLIHTSEPIEVTKGIINKSVKL